MYRLVFRLIVLRSRLMAYEEVEQNSSKLSKTRVFISYNFFLPRSESVQCSSVARVRSIHLTSAMHVLSQKY